MAAKPDKWMPLYVGDYLRKTGRLTTIEHGAYLLIIFEVWVNGFAPDDDRSLAAIAKATPKEWKRIRPKIEAFFNIADGKWLHDRVSEEKENAERLSAIRRKSGKDGANRRWQNDDKDDGKTIANAMAKTSQEGSQNDRPSPSPSPITNELDTSTQPYQATATTVPAAPRGASQRHPDFIKTRERIEQFLNSPSCTHLGLIDTWLRAGADLEIDILPVMARLKGKWRGLSLQFFDGAVMDSVSVRSRPSSNVTQITAAPRPVETAEGKRQLLESKANLLNKGIRFDETTQADVREMLKEGLTTPDKAIALGFAA